MYLELTFLHLISLIGHQLSSLLANIFLLLLSFNALVGNGQGLASKVGIPKTMQHVSATGCGQSAHIPRTVQLFNRYATLTLTF